MHCHDMKRDQVFRCEQCGLELKVTHECKDAGKGRIAIQSVSSSAATKSLF